MSVFSPALARLCRRDMRVWFPRTQWNPAVGAVAAAEAARCKQRGPLFFFFPWVTFFLSVQMQSRHQKGSKFGTAKPKPSTPPQPPSYRVTNQWHNQSVQKQLDSCVKITTGSHGYGGPQWPCVPQINNVKSTQDNRPPCFPCGQWWTAFLPHHQRPLRRDRPCFKAQTLMLFFFPSSLTLAPCPLNNVSHSSSTAPYYPGKSYWSIFPISEEVQQTFAQDLL